MKNSCIYMLMAFGLMSCGKLKDSDRIFEAKILEGQALSNHQVLLEADLSDAYVNGIVLPSAEKDYFKFSFKIKNAEKKQQYYYRIYYQNVSYKNPEFIHASSQYNVNAADNFYGSWMDSKFQFKSIGQLEEGESISIQDSFKIAGNPRNEIKYFGIPVENQMVNDSIIESRLNLIRISPDWVASVEEKAKAKNRSLEEQMYLDALWTIDNEMDPKIETIVSQDSILKEIRAQILSTPDWTKSIKEKAEQFGNAFEEQMNKDVNWVYQERYPGNKQYVNNRKKRNPRMGEYQFLLVVLTEEEYNQLPRAIRNIGEKDEIHENYLNPFYFFDPLLYQNQKACFRFKESLKVYSTFVANQGVYVDPLSLKNSNMSKSTYSNGVGSSKKLYKHALYEQYFHEIDKEYKLKNVPVLADIAQGEYSRTDYEQNKSKFPLNKREVRHTSITNQPGKTVFFDSTANAIRLINPGNINKDRKDWSKENVGVKTRIGLSYGKFTGKIKFSETLNKENIWNGITAAFWLFSEKMEPWNERNVCANEGYLPKSERKPSTNKFPTSMYSEIDIEIVKTSKFWPKSSYGGIEDFPLDAPENNNNLIITCTNWDMTCRDPKNFNQGVYMQAYNDQEFGLHRWDYWYHALTSKFEHPHEQTVGGEFYYQIEWKPNEIIWRVGPSEEELRVVGYMNEDNTKIPNNQMISIVTQEFHYSDWWPLAPFDQNNIPFPKNDIEGFVYEIKVE